MLSPEMKARHREGEIGFVPTLVLMGGPEDSAQKTFSSKKEEHTAVAV